MPVTLRRRTPGLRREEVAELAGISAALYTWLEQGRDIPVSARTIDAIADALQLTSSERLHAQRLVRPGTAELREEISPALRRTTESLRAHPLFVLDHAWDIVLMNDAATLVFGHAEAESDANIMVAAFTQCRFRSLFEDWEMVARGLLEGFRLDFAMYADQARPQEIVAKLDRESELFRTLWGEHRVSEFPKGLRVLNHPVVGRLVLEPTIYGVVESPGLRILLFTPYEAETAVAIEGLVRDFPAVNADAASRIQFPCVDPPASAS